MDISVFSFIWNDYSIYYPPSGDFNVLHDTGVYDIGEEFTDILREIAFKDLVLRLINELIYLSVFFSHVYPKMYLISGFPKEFQI